jgi:SAM-dependent methyltransferase
MTDESACPYDTQVEVLFNGTANATPRQALPQLHEVFAGRDQRELRLLDIGCGTGRFLDFVKQAWPRLLALGLDIIRRGSPRRAVASENAALQPHLAAPPVCSHWIGSGAAYSRTVSHSRSRHCRPAPVEIANRRELLFIEIGAHVVVVLPITIWARKSETLGGESYNYHENRCRLKATSW